MARYPRRGHPEPDEEPDNDADDRRPRGGRRPPGMRAALPPQGTQSGPMGNLMGLNSGTGEVTDYGPPPGTRGEIPPGFDPANLPGWLGSGPMGNLMGLNSGTGEVTDYGPPPGPRGIGDNGGPNGDVPWLNPDGSFNPNFQFPTGLGGPTGGGLVGRNGRRVRGGALPGGGGGMRSMPMPILGGGFGGVPPEMLERAANEVGFGPREAPGVGRMGLATPPQGQTWFRGPNGPVLGPIPADDGMMHGFGAGETRLNQPQMGVGGPSMAPPQGRQGVPPGPLPTNNPFGRNLVRRQR